jgi:hypothetical protein
MKTKKKILGMGTTLLVLGAVLFQSFTNRMPAAEETKFTPLGEFLHYKKVDTRVKSLGGFQENCIAINIQNLTSDTLFVLLEPGRRLVSKDSLQQDIFIVKENRVSINPFATNKVIGYGFCCRSNKHSPEEDSEFDIGYMAPPEWIQLAELINKNNFPALAVQSAVWALSNDHSISSIYSKDEKSVKLLKETVAKIKGIEIPWYSITYENDTALVFSNRPKNVFGQFKYYLNKNAIVTVNVKNARGTLMKTILRGLDDGPGSYTCDVDLDVRNWPKGTYYIYVYEDYSNLNLKKSFIL